MNVIVVVVGHVMVAVAVIIINIIIVINGICNGCVIFLILVHNHI